jgi:hypothetical protein
MMAAADPRSLSLGRAIWLLLRLRGRILLSGFRRASLRRKVSLGALGLLIGYILVILYLGSRGLIGLLGSPEIGLTSQQTGLLLDSLPTILTSASFIFILMTSFGLLLQALYLARDMDFLLSAPLPAHAVFASKLLEATIPNFLLLLGISLPVLFGLGAAGDYGLPFYLMAPPMLAAMALAAAGSSGVLVMVIARWFPPRRVAEVLGFAGALASILCSQTGTLTAGRSLDPQRAGRALEMVSRLNSPWSPLAWAGRGLLGLGRSQWLPGAGLSLLALLAAGTVFAVTLQLAERLYASGWARMLTGGIRRAAARRIRPQSLRLSTRGRLDRPHSVLLAIITKDFKVLRRDLRSLSQILTPLIIGIVYAVLLIGGGSPMPAEALGSVWAQDFLRQLGTLSVLGISLFVGWTLATRLAAISFAHEGQGYWLLKVSPVSSGMLLLSKYALVYLPTAALAALFVVAVGLLNRLSPAQLAFALGASTMSLAGLAGVSLAFGVAGANLEWDDPRHMMRGGAGCLSLIVGAIYLLFDVALFMLPAFGLPALGVSPGWSAVLGTGAGSSFALVCAVLPPRMVLRRVDRMGEHA